MSEPSGVTNTSNVALSAMLLLAGWFVGLFLIPVPLLTSGLGLSMLKEERSGWGSVVWGLHLVTVIITGGLLAVLGLALVIP